MNRVWVLVLLSWSAAQLPAVCAGARWQYYVPFETGRTAENRTSEPGKAFLWLPPESKTLRGVLVGGELGIELEVALDPSVRSACADNDLAIVYFSPHLSGVFHFWDDKGHDGERWLKAFDDLARRTEHPELRRIPWITMGHSTAGIFCRNVAYWKPNRVAAILHIKSGNFRQKENLPPNGSLAGIPLLAINGQFETYGPEGGIRPELGRETQWQFVRNDIEQLRQSDPRHLISNWLDLGGDHFFGSSELSNYAAMYIRKTAQYRLPPALPAVDADISCMTIKPEDGWLTDPNLYHPTHPAAAYAAYSGDKRVAMWHFDREIAEANSLHHRHLGAHQALSNPTMTWLDDGDGWTFRASSLFLDVMPSQYGGNVGGQMVGHATTPILYRARITEPVLQLGPDTFRALRVAKSINIAAVNEGDSQFRATNRLGGAKVPTVKGDPQTIDFPPIPDFRVSSSAVELRATSSSGLAVYFEVEYGPIIVKNGKLELSELPARASLPMECGVTAWQIGRRVEPPIASAPPVLRRFSVVKP